MYTITFEDNTIFKGGEPEDSKWNDIPNKTIKQIKYIYKNKMIVLEGYSEYCHIKKKGNFLIGNFNGILQVILMARNDKETIQFIWDLLKGKFYTSITEINKEYNNGKVTGWKKGLSSRIPTYKITRL